MFNRQFVRVAAFSAVTVWGASSVLGAITIPTVSVGNPGNAPDTTGYGAVSYSYNIASTEVTNAQYAAFLNAVGASDPNNLYDIEMGGMFGGITRNGSAGSYSYATISGRENHPIEFVDFWDTTRFANWLNNGQPTGAQDNTTTEDGTYTLTPGGITANTVTRNAGWQWAVASEDEWYKAAYHQPASQGGDADDYWFYPTSSNTITHAQANYGPAIVNTPLTTPVGSYAANYYGAFDMGGNVWEWNDTIVNGFFRGYRGGSAYHGIESLGADARLANLPNSDGHGLGFRVSQVPEPSSIALLTIGVFVIARRRRN